MMDLVILDNILKPYNASFCLYTHMTDDNETQMYPLLNCVLHMWFLALRLTRQEHSAPTLGDMIEKVLPGK